MRRSRLVLCCIAGSAAAVGAHAQVASTFDSGADGWLAIGNGPGGVTFEIAAGNPGGAISLTDVIDQFGYFGAPASYLAAGGYGGVLAYDMRATTSGPAPIAFPVQVALEGDGMVLVLGFGRPTGSYVRYEYDLIETAGWRVVSTRDLIYSPSVGVAATEADMRRVLDSLTGIYIGSDHTLGTTVTGTTEVAFLDNVELVPGSTCPADTNGDGTLTPADFNAWVIAFNSQAPECDQNGDGQCTPADFNAWVVNFNAGC